MLYPTLFHLLSQLIPVLMNLSTIHALVYLSISLLLGLRAWKQLSAGEWQEATTEAALAVLHLILALATAAAPTHC